MRVLHVIPSLSPALGGPTQVALNLVRALRQVGVEAEIATTNDNGATLLEVPLGQRVEYEQVPVWFLPRFTPPLKEFIFSAALTRWLWQQIPTYDLLDLHYLFSYAPTCAGAIARWRHIPYTVRTMGQLSPWALAQSRLKKQVYTALIERHNLTRAAAIHCTSAGEAADVRQFGISTPLITLPLGVIPPVPWPDARQKLRQTYGLGATTPVILFLARLHYKKRPDLLLQALGTLAATHEFYLILAGAGTPEYEAELTNLVADLGLTSRVTCPGLVTGADKDLLLQGSDLFVLPSFSENFGIAVAEAMAAGLPVVLTPEVQIAPEVEAAAAGIVMPGTREALAGAIAHLLTHPEQRQQFGANGRQLVAQRYAWEAIAQQLKPAYQQVLDQPRFLGK